MRQCIFWSYAHTKGTDQPARPLSLIRAFLLHCLDNIIPLESIFDISRVKLGFVTVQDGCVLCGREH